MYVSISELYAITVRRLQLSWWQTIVFIIVKIVEYGFRFTLIVEIWWAYQIWLIYSIFEDAVLWYQWSVKSYLNNVLEKSIQILSIMLFTQYV